LIGANGYRLLNPALHEIMDTAPRGAIVDAVQNAARSVPGVIEVEKCFIRKMGLSFYVDLHVGVNGNISVREGHRIAHDVKRAIQASDARIADVLVHIEPVRM
jgi:divalent metal cation (Fe/Co/Zn/Cd) transporter